MCRLGAVATLVAVSACAAEEEPVDPTAEPQTMSLFGEPLYADHLVGARAERDEFAVRLPDQEEVHWSRVQPY